MTEAAVDDVSCRCVMKTRIESQDGVCICMGDEILRGSRCNNESSGQTNNKGLTSQTVIIYRIAIREDLEAHLFSLVSFMIQIPSVLVLWYVWYLRTLGGSSLALALAAA